MSVQYFAGRSINSRSNIRVQQGRIADGQLIHVTDEKLDDTRGDFFLQAQEPEGRASLSGTVERRKHAVEHHLLW